MIRSTDISWFSELVLRIYACTREADLFDLWTFATHNRMRATTTTIEEVATDYSSYAVHRIRGWNPPPYYVAALSDNLLAAHIFSVGGVGTFHHGSLISRREHERTNTYNLVYRPAGFSDVIIASAQPRSDVVLTFDIARDRVFKPEERHLIELIRRHLEASAIRVRSLHPSDSPSPLPESQILLGRDHRPLALSAWIQQFLVSYFPSDRAALAAGRLPEELVRWVRGSLARMHRRPPLHPLTYFRTLAARGALIVRVFPGQPHGGALLKLTEELWPPHPLAWRARGLSARECEVLHWLAQGKRDNEIAKILAITTGTVSKHVEHLLKKLQVSSRSAAARVLWNGIEE